MNKNTLVVGFMLFAMFFGAGNLIFPPRLGLEHSVGFWPAVLGFVVTGVSLPIIGIIVSSYYEGGYKKALDRIHPWFSILFLSAIYLSIGPFFAIPRTAATAYEIAIVPFTNEPSSISLLIFTALYFAIALWLALNPSKMVERIGAILTPVLLLSIFALIIRAFFLLDEQPHVEPTSTQTGSPFFQGILAGYFTMDALAAIAFSVIVIMSIKNRSISTEQSSLRKQTIIASFISVTFLALIYIALAWIGRNLPISAETLQELANKEQDVGTYILNLATVMAFGEFGRTILGIIVSLACLTTAIGLIASVSEYFNEIYHKISYKTYVVICTLIGFVLSNQGLSAVISKSVPMLLILYPIAITVILLLSVNIIIKLPLLAQRLAMAFVTLISIASVSDLAFTQVLPLKSYSMEWIPFAIAGCVLGCMIETWRKTKQV
ncbi:branched-chain amino acid transport system II carrier protein [Conservatibacter flavescens]|uniref:Branched-chain amino acid transport system carrier protein n=1 Tax=Conservatibacter flavescens TaxID=28161 RepID=A0A2M8RZR9_9PAST|nr:branched-chain amino acid transport system II carrier protein [Conservatibacter flavescens]PJG84392.1 branched-chain amino acid transport system II carrier protein [Conservatibacter flavescens]